MLLRRFHCRTMEEVYESMPKEEIDFVKDWLDKGDGNEVLIDKMKLELNALSLEEQTATIQEFLSKEDSSCFEELYAAVPDKALLLDQFEMLSYMDRMNLLSVIPFDDLAIYINNKGKNSDEILKVVSKRFDVAGTGEKREKQDKFMGSLDSDLDRAKLLLYGGNSEFMPYIKDLFYLNQITKSKSNYYYSIDVLLREIDEYNSFLARATEIKDERERAEFIASIDNNEMKEALLLSLIQQKENIDIVAKSFKRTVDPEIKSIDELTQTMIIEFLEDELGEDFTDDKREKVSIVFNRTDVKFDECDLNINGKAEYIRKRITIEDKHKENINRCLGFLIHEYGHLFSFFNYCYKREIQGHMIEEGMVDIFADLVINHYINKHKNITIDGRRVRIDNPYSIYTGHDMSNSWARTMLAGLQPSKNDIRALGEYVLGDKNIYANMVFGEEEAQSKKHTKYGNIIIDATRDELYYSPTLDFSNIDENSIYYKRNCILPWFKIKRTLKANNCPGYDFAPNMEEDESFDAAVVAQDYFEGKKFYEVPKDQFEEFIKLLEDQSNSYDGYVVINNIEDYKEELIFYLNLDEIRQFSFEIIERIPMLIESESNDANMLEPILRVAFEEEIKKIRNGQSSETTKEKLDIVTKEYDGRFSGDAEYSLYIRDYINNFCFEANESLEFEKGYHQPIDGKKNDENVEKAQGRQDKLKVQKMQILPEQVGRAVENVTLEAMQEADGNLNSQGDGPILAQHED